MGPYVLDRQLGAGGMGEVWLARRADGVVKEPAAVKLLHAHLAGSALRERFLREGRILGQLSHPNIARLLDAGLSSSGQPYLALEYVEGVALDRWCDEKHLDIDARVRLFLQVCEAVAHAHAHLVVHRDLKPSNILVTRDGGVKLLDFGIAKLMEGDTVETEVTRIAGRAFTPEYAAPEQVTNQPITVAADVYSLGVILYLLLSGKLPYGGATPSQIERAVVETEPAPPSTTQRRLPRDLDLIVMKALKRKPDERYASVTAFAEDLRRYLNSEPVIARPDSVAYRARKYVRRHRVGAAIVAILAAGLAATSALYVKARVARQQAEKELAQSTALSDFLQWDFLSSITSSSGDTRALNAAKALLDTGAAKIDARLARQPVVAIKLRNSFANAYRNLKFVEEAEKLNHVSIEQARSAIDANASDALDIGAAMIADSFAGFREIDARYTLRLAQLARERWPRGDTRRLWLLQEERNVDLVRGDYDRERAVLVEYENEAKLIDPGAESYDGLTQRVDFGHFDEAMIAGDYASAEAISQKLVEAVVAEGRHGDIVSRAIKLTYVRRFRSDIMMLTGRLAEAEREIDASLADLRANVDPDNEWQLLAQLDLGLLRSLQGRTVEAEAITDSAVAAIDRTIALDLQRWDFYKALYRQLVVQGRHALAAARLRELIAATGKVDPPDSLEIARERIVLADALRAQGLVAESAAQLALIPPSTVAKLEQSPPDRIDWRRAQGLRALDEGQRDEAMAKLSEAVALAENVYTEKSFWTQRLRRELASAR